jgi:hypothetical protein
MAAPILRLFAVKRVVEKLLSFDSGFLQILPPGPAAAVLDVQVSHWGWHYWVMA